MRLLQSLTRGLKALDILREADAPLRLTHIAELLDVDKSNASHILKTLVAAGYASQNLSRRYSAVSQKTCSTNQHSLTEVIACKERCRLHWKKSFRQQGNVLILRSWLKTECGI